MSQEELECEKVLKRYSELCELSPARDRDARHILTEAKRCIENTLKGLSPQLSAKTLFEMLQRLEEVGEIANPLLSELHQIRSVRNDVEYDNYVPLEHEAKKALVVLLSFIEWVAKAEIAAPSAEIKNVIVEQGVSRGHQFGVVVRVNIAVNNFWDRAGEVWVEYDHEDCDEGVDDDEDFEKCVSFQDCEPFNTKHKRYEWTDLQIFTPYAFLGDAGCYHGINLYVWIEDDAGEIMASRFLGFFVNPR